MVTISSRNISFLQFVGPRTIIWINICEVLLLRSSLPKQQPLQRKLLSHCSIRPQAFYLAYCSSQMCNNLHSSTIHIPVELWRNHSFAVFSRNFVFRLSNVWPSDDLIFERCNCLERVIIQMEQLIAHNTSPHDENHICHRVEMIHSSL